jgi:hypothetical protein
MGTLVALVTENAAIFPVPESGTNPTAAFELVH